MEVILIHTTHEAVRESILKHGVAVRFSTGAFRRVWAHKAFLKKWGRNHVCKRHAVKTKDVIHITIVVPDSWVKRYKDGIYFCERDIPPAHIQQIEGAV